MAITYPLSMPTVPTSRQISLEGDSAVAITQSPYTLTQQIQEYGGEMWRAKVSIAPTKTRAQAEAWISFLLALRGRKGTFLLGDPNGKTPRGVATGSPVVDGGSQTVGGGTLALRGFPNSVTGILLAGDYLQLTTTRAAGGSVVRLYKNLTDANSDGTGRVTLDIFPKLHEAPADATAIVLSNAKGEFRLATNTRGWTLDQALVYGIDFEAWEAV
jgi:hypothetical protein